MKKLWAILLSLTLMLSLSVAALAEEQTQTQTVSVTIPNFDYTVTIPTINSITYGNTGGQAIGKFTVSSTDWDTFRNNGKCVYVNVTPDLTLKNENGHTISYTWKTDTGDTETKYFQGDAGQGYKITVPDWSDAQSGTTYTTTITYAASVTAKPE